MKACLTLGPILFHWSAEKKRDFYFRIADEAPVGTVYLGEVVCSKRSPFFEPYYDEVADRLVSAGKTVVFSTLAEIMISRERKMTAGICELEGYEIEANDLSALYFLRGRPYRVGQYFNVYNEETMAFLQEKGASHITLPAELPQSSLSILGRNASAMNISLEAQVYGRVGLALSARCYHARAHGRIKDNCQFVCEEDPDGMPLKTINGLDFLAVNGVQTLSHSCLNLIHEIKEMMAMGIDFFRLSPQDCDMVKVAECFEDVLSERIGVKEAYNRLSQISNNYSFCNGFYHSVEGYRWVPHG